MAIGLRRKVRLDSRRDNQKITRRANGAIKNGERERRATRIIAKIKSSTAPYSPEVNSWLALQFGKPASRISEDEIKTLIG